MYTIFTKTIDLPSCLQCVKNHVRYIYDMTMNA